MHISVGDLFSSKADMLVNTVNCVGVMGKGIAKEFKRRYPVMFSDYRRRCQEGAVKLGEPYLFRDPSGLMILNFPTKNHWRSSSRIQDIEKGLDWFVENYRELGAASVAFPPLGCGNGGLDWRDVGPLMYQKLSGLAIDVEVFAPIGTDEYECSEEFLKQGSWNQAAIGKRAPRLRRTWRLIPLIIQRMNSSAFNIPVGHTIYQKICYLLTCCGIETGFTFVKGDYGPFSRDAKLALAILANNDLVYEEPLGRMVQIKVTDSFTFNKSAYSAHELQIANSVTDLFCRLRNTEQAEEVASILYAYSNLTDASRQQGMVDVSSLLDYLFDWKPHWRGDAQKQSSLLEDCCYLTALGWVHVGGLSFDEVE